MKTNHIKSRPAEGEVTADFPPSSSHSQVGGVWPGVARGFHRPDGDPGRAGGVRSGSHTWAGILGWSRRAFRVAGTKGRLEYGAVSKSLLPRQSACRGAGAAMPSHDTSDNPVTSHAPGALRAKWRKWRKGKTRADLDTDRPLNLSLVRLLEIVGEAASRVPVE